MKLSFYGAAREVTGSCFCLEAQGRRILIDCGMEQGMDQYEKHDIPISGYEVDCVLLTHAHIDHSGELPLLYAKGFRGPVYATGATQALCEIMLRDCAHIQEFEAEWRNRKLRRSGGDPFLPNYTMEDAVGVLRQFRPFEYGAVFPVAQGVTARFVDAGHLLGSASIEVWVEEDGVKRKLVFSGDIGNLNQPLINDPQYVTQADYVVMESTYGDRSHGPRPDYAATLAAVIQETFDRGGNVVIPSFAVGRTQEMLYFLREIKKQGLVKGHGNFPVYVDSPLAIAATSIFGDHTKGYYDQEALALLSQGINPIAFPGLVAAETGEDSKRINADPVSKVIISASGMCDAGRVRHHLKHNLWRQDSTILFVGYQAEGTLGRMLLDGEKNVRLFGEDIEVNARIERFEGISGHADREGLLRWVESYAPKPRRVFVVHGQSEVSDHFAGLLESRGFDAVVPGGGAQFDLASGMMLLAGAPERPAGEHAGKKPARDARLGAYERLEDAGKRLMAIIRANVKSSGKNLAKFAGQVNALSDKWDRHD